LVRRSLPKRSPDAAFQSAADPAGVLLGGGKLATELDRLDLIDE
jgi:hypothetical protein